MSPAPQYDAVVIGSGFGGSINALRLARAGRQVLVLERGRRYRPGEFPRDIRDIRRLFWRYPRHPDFRGLYDIRFLTSLIAVVASGVGGGSLIYANIHIRPDPDVFDDPRWPAAIKRQTLDRHYDTVARMLAVAPVPPELNLPKRAAFAAAARSLGREVFDPDQAVKWDPAPLPGREPCRLCAECEFGCQYGAKSTLDLTYLAEAERLSALVRPDSYVTHIEPSESGYRVHYLDMSGINPGVHTHSVLARRVVISAGTLGTNELLLRCRDVRRTLPLLSSKLGWGYSANGDFLGTLTDSASNLEPWNGPDVTSVIRFPDPLRPFTMAAPTFDRPVMEALVAMGRTNVSWLRCLSPLLWRIADPLLIWAFRSGIIAAKPAARGQPKGDPARTTNLFAIGRDNAAGRIVLRRGQLDVRWDYARDNASLISDMTRAMQQVADQYGGKFAPIPIWQVFRRITTVHSLGGCHLSDSADRGVVTANGEVHGYPGLFVADGSVIPTAIGFHPAMTIAAISEHIAESVVASF